MPGPPPSVVPVDSELAQRVTESIGRVMLDEVGIVRTDESLARACSALEEMEQELAETDPAPVELNNKLTVARLVAQSARARRESRGVHYNADHPERDDENWQHDNLIRASR